MSAAQHKHLSATELLIYAMEQLDKDEVDRIVVITLDKDGSTLGLHSNTRSQPELYGMLGMAQEMWDASDEAEA